MDLPGLSSKKGKAPYLIYLVVGLCLAALLQTDARAEETRQIQIEKYARSLNMRGLSFSHFYKREIQDLTKHFGIKEVSSAAQANDKSWVFAQNGIGLSRYDGLDIIPIEIPFEGTVGQIHTSGTEFAVFLIGEQNFVGFYDINTEEWRQLTLPSSFRFATLTQFANGRMDSGIAMAFQKENRIGFIFLDKRNVRITGHDWLSDISVRSCYSLQWFDKNRWIFKDRNNLVTIRSGREVNIEMRQQPIEKIDRVISVGPGTAILVNHTSGNAGRVNSRTYIFSDEGVSEMMMFTGQITGSPTGEVHFLQSLTSAPAVFKLEKNRLRFSQFGPPLSLRPTDRFDVSAEGQDGAVFYSGGNRCLIINPWRNLIGNAKPLLRPQFGGKNGEHLSFYADKDRFVSNNFPEKLPKIENDSNILHFHFPWKIDKNLNITNHYHPEHRFKISKTLLGQVSRFRQVRYEFDEKRNRVLCYPRRNFGRMDDVIIIAKNRVQRKSYLKSGSFNMRNLVPIKDGYYELVGQISGSFSQRFISLYKLDENFNVLSYDEFEIKPGQIVLNPKLYAKHIIPNLVNEVKDYNTLRKLLGEEDFHEFEPGKLIRAFPVREGANILLLEWRNNQFNTSTHRIEGNPSEYFGKNNHGRLVFRGGPATSFVEFKVNGLEIESRYDWSFPDDYTIAQAITSPNHNTWLFIERTGFEPLFIFELKDNQQHKPELSVNILNKSIQSEDTFTVELDVKRPFMLEDPIIPYYFKWRAQGQPWSERMPIPDNPIELKPMELSSGDQRLEFKLISYFNEDGVSTTSTYLNVLPIPLQKRAWFPFAIITIFSILILLLIFATIQSIKSIRNARSLAVLNRELEHRVLERTAEIDAQNQELQATNVLLEDANEKLLETGKALAEASRKAGMAQVASGVIHNVGNVFNSLTVSLNLLQKDGRVSKVSAGINKLFTLFSTNRDNSEFWNDTKKRSAAIDYLGQLDSTLTETSTNFKSEFEHIEERMQKVAGIIRSQEKYAKSPTDVKQECSLREMVNEALDVVSMQVPLGDMEISLTNELENDTALLDITYTRQILSVVIENAYDASVAQGNTGPIHIALNAKTDSREASISVSDQGIGIREEDMKHLFSHGFSTKSDGDGSSLHDAVNLARVMGGNITAESNGIGEGSCFYFELPPGALVASKAEA